MSDISKSAFEQTIVQLLTASPKNSSKGDPMKDWFLQSFNAKARVARITEDKQLGNRITEQFTYKDAIVVFVLEPSVNRDSLVRKISERQYVELVAVLIVGANGANPPYTYEHLLIRRSNQVTKWMSENLSVECEMIYDSSAGNLSSKDTLQRIIYGAPGTGKSWSIEELVKNVPDQVVRTTFHPDSDYSTFVGAYKPTMADVPWYYIDKGKKACVLDENDQPAKETKIVYKFVEQAFTKAYVKAWKAQATAIRDGKDSAAPIYLVIEEINRGNCAQIFGDIFQLLDREDGYSKYPVKADEDLRRHLKEAFDKLDFGAKYAKVQTGEDLVLPNNLCIWATMNTSDQSLFPMDSAFKRRWDWEYVPIVEGEDRAGNKLGWEIVVKDGESVLRYDWWAFLTSVNAKIFQLTDSEDKKLGYFFAKAGDDKIISAETFVGKVVFYLWNDVYKDYGIAEIFKCGQNGETAEDKKVKGVAYQAFYAEDGKSVNVTTLKNFFKAVGVEPKSAPQA